jgi:hypothetical protein
MRERAHTLIPKARLTWEGERAREKERARMKLTQGLYATQGGSGGVWEGGGEGQRERERASELGVVREVAPVTKW